MLGPFPTVFISWEVGEEIVRRKGKKKEKGRSLSIEAQKGRGRSEVFRYFTSSGSSGKLELLP